MSEHRRETKRMRANGKDAIVNVMTEKQQEEQLLKEEQVRGAPASPRACACPEEEG